MFVKDYGAKVFHIQREGKVNVCGRKRCYAYPGEIPQDELVGTGIDLMTGKSVSYKLVNATGCWPYATCYQTLPDGARLCKTCQKIAV